MYDLRSGDDIKLGNTIFTINIDNPEEIIIPNFVPQTVNADQDLTQAPNFLEVLKRWLGLAANGNQNLQVIQGYNLIKILGKGGFGKAGTPVFIPRQQLLNFKYVQPDVDIWATAACLYNMLTGTYPRNFSGNDPFLAVLQNDPVPIRQRDASIPPRLAEVIDLGLVEKPEIYFKSAADFKQALLAIS